MTDTLTLRRPDDWHVHLRDGALLRGVINQTARQFGRAIIMPNLNPPVTTTKAAADYRERILDALDPNLTFEPLMTAYLSDDTDPDELRRGKAENIFTAAKLYPAHATTNSAHGVSDIAEIHDVLDTMSEIGLPLLVHGEVTHKEVDIFDREAVFIDDVMSKIIRDFPDLKIVFEHITTKDAADFVQSAGPNIAATITPHHLAFNRNAIFQGGIRPHFYCLPIAKREKHRLALRKAATSGNPKFFLGTDSAPHPVTAKESACGCAGLFNAPYALESYAMTFEQEGALDKLEGFASEHGPQFYGLPLNEGTVTLKRQDTTVPERLFIKPMGGETMSGETLSGETEIVPFLAGETIPWTFTG